MFFIKTSGDFKSGCARKNVSQTGEIFSVSSSGSKVMLTNPDNLEIKRERIDPKSSLPLYESWNRNVVPYMKMSTLSSKHECSNGLPVMALVLVKQAQKVKKVLSVLP